ncbi:hypothetical protein ACJJTC_004654 [Scirpophaga incertulas]
MPPPKMSSTSSNTSRRSLENPAEETEKEETINPPHPPVLTSLSLDRPSSSARDYVIEGGGESPAPPCCGTSSKISILEDIQIAPPKTTRELMQTPVHMKPEKPAPRAVKMPSESPASPDDEDEFQTPTRTPTREVEIATVTARPAGSARDAASRDASRERATARAADASAPRGCAVVSDAPLGATRAPLGSAAAASAPRGSAGAADASRDGTGTPAPRGSGGKAGPSKPSGRESFRKTPQTTATITKKLATPHLAIKRGTTTITPATQKVVVPKRTPTLPKAPQNTPTTPARIIILPARDLPASRSQTDMLPPPTPQTRRPRSRQSEGSARSDRSIDATPERYGSYPSLGPSIAELRALVSTPPPGFGPSAPTPFSGSTTSIPETPRTQKRAREEGDSDKSDHMKPAIRPKTDPSPASQMKMDTETSIDPLPSTSYADRTKTTHPTETPTTKPKKRRGGRGRGPKATRTAENTNTQPQANDATRAAAATTTTTATATTTATTTTATIHTPAAAIATIPSTVAISHTTEPLPQRPRPSKRREPSVRTAAPTATTTAITSAEVVAEEAARPTTTTSVLTNEPVVAALLQGTKAKPASEEPVNDTIRDVLVQTLQDLIQDLQRGINITSERKKEIE